MKTLLLGALVVVVAACRHETGLHLPPPGIPTASAPAPELDTRRKLDKATGQVLREWSRLVYTDRPPVKHGRETSWYPSGAKQWEREYDEGRPYGTWRAWYEDGKPRSESFFGEPDVDTTMTFWHPNGQMSMQGPARNGVRRGEWTLWYQNGQIAERGQFSGSLREGRWIAWSIDGSQRFERIYARNTRVSETPIGPEDEAPAAAAEGDEDLQDEPVERRPK